MSQVVSALGRATIALIAHDSRKLDLIRFAEQYRAILARYRLIATSTTGDRLAAALDLTVERKLSGPLGGDAQIAAEVAAGGVQAVFFLIDPLCSQPHDADIQSLLRLCNVHNVAVATNLSTANLLIEGLPVRSRAEAPCITAVCSGLEPVAKSRPLQSRPAASRPLNLAPDASS